MSIQKKHDVVLVGAGHNGLVCATFLARAGLSVCVVEDKDQVGGAVKTERPFAKVPALATSTGAYLLGLMPPELATKLGIELPVLRRDPHYFLPTTDGRYLLFGSDEQGTREQMRRFFSEKDVEANDALQAEIAALREDVAPTWLEDPLSIEATAERYVRAPLRKAFVDLCRGSVGDYLDRFGFQSDLLRAMYAVTDGFSGLFGTWDTKGTGMNFLVHNMCRLPGSGGTWMIVKGGMGTVTQLLADAARKAGAEIVTGRRVAAITTSSGRVTGVAFEDGTTIDAGVVVSNADPFTTADLLPEVSAPFQTKLHAWDRPGSTMKVNLALRGLPKFSCLPEDRGQFGPTIHILPDEKDVMRSLREGFDDVKNGRLPAFPTIEWYIHTTVDPSLKDPAGHHNSALFVQWVPYALSGTTWEAEEDKYVKHLLSLCDRFAPGTSDLVADTFTLTPPKVEKHFGIRRGHIHHVDNGFGFDDRVPYTWPVEGLFSCSAGCHPAGSVIGAAGHNAANAVLRALGRG